MQQNEAIRSPKNSDTIMIRDVQGVIVEIQEFLDDEIRLDYPGNRHRNRGVRYGCGVLGAVRDNEVY